MSSAGRWASATPAFETSFKGSAHVGQLIASREQAMANLLADAVPQRTTDNGPTRTAGYIVLYTAKCEIRQAAYGYGLLNFLVRIFRPQHGLQVIPTFA
jgi:hypothetical protein